MRTPLPLFSFSLWMCSAAVAAPLQLDLEKIIKEPQEEEKVNGDRLFLFWINRKTTRGRFLPPVAIAKSFIPIWKSFELMYMHSTRKRKIYSDYVTYTSQPSLLKISEQQLSVQSNTRALGSDFWLCLPSVSCSVFFSLLMHNHVVLFFQFVHWVEELMPVSCF